jgi:hypothetical protein
MVRRVGPALSLFLCVALAHAHNPFLLDARRATAGPQLELIELPSAAGTVEKKYRVKVGTGLPKGVVYGVFTKPYDHGFHEVEPGFQLDDSGNLVAAGPGGQKRRLEEIVLGPGPYPRGAAWELALVAADKSVRLFAKVIPHSIVATNGPCTVSLELASHLGERFNASGIGFPAGEEVMTEHQYSGRVIRKQRRVSPEGTLAPDLITHREIGADRGARYTVKSQACEVSIDYDCGEPALLKQ